MESGKTIVAVYIVALAVGVFFVTRGSFQKSNPSRGARLSIVLLGAVFLVWGTAAIVTWVDRHDRKLSIPTLRFLEALRYYAGGCILGAGSTLVLTGSFVGRSSDSKLETQQGKVAER